MSTSYSYYLEPSEDDRYRCRHVFIDGHRCGSPCLREQDFCYYHHTTRRPVQNAAERKARLSTFELNPADLVDRSGVLHAIAQVLERIAANELDPRRAGLLLYGLQTAVIALPKPSAEAAPPLMVDEITEDATLGTLAPREKIRNLVKSSPFRALFDKLERNRNSGSEEEVEKEESRRWASPADEIRSRSAIQGSHTWTSPADEFRTKPEAEEPARTVLPDVQAVAEHARRSPAYARRVAHNRKYFSRMSKFAQRRRAHCPILVVGNRRFVRSPLDSAAAMALTQPDLCRIQRNDRSTPCTILETPNSFRRPS